MSDLANLGIIDWGNMTEFPPEGQQWYQPAQERKHSMSTEFTGFCMTDENEETRSKRKKICENEDVILVNKDDQLFVLDESEKLQCLQNSGGIHAKQDDQLFNSEKLRSEDNVSSRSCENHDGQLRDNLNTQQQDSQPSIIENSERLTDTEKTLQQDGQLFDEKLPYESNLDREMLIQHQDSLFDSENLFTDSERSRRLKPPKGFYFINDDDPSPQKKKKGKIRKEKMEKTNFLPKKTVDRLEKNDYSKDVFDFEELTEKETFLERRQNIDKNSAKPTLPKKRGRPRKENTDKTYLPPKKTKRLKTMNYSKDVFDSEEPAETFLEWSEKLNINEKSVAANNFSNDVFDSIPSEKETSIDLNSTILPPNLSTERTERLENESSEKAIEYPTWRSSANIEHSELSPEASKLSKQSPIFAMKIEDISGMDTRPIGSNIQDNTNLSREVIEATETVFQKKIPTRSKIQDNIIPSTDVIDGTEFPKEIPRHDYSNDVFASSTNATNLPFKANERSEKKASLKTITKCSEWLSSVKVDRMVSPDQTKRSELCAPHNYQTMKKPRDLDVSVTKRVTKRDYQAKDMNLSKDVIDAKDILALKKSQAFIHKKPSFCSLSTIKKKSSPKKNNLKSRKNFTIQSQAVFKSPDFPKSKFDAFKLSKEQEIKKPILLIGTQEPMKSVQSQPVTGKWKNQSKLESPQGVFRSKSSDVAEISAQERTQKSEIKSYETEKKKSNQCGSSNNLMSDILELNIDGNDILPDNLDFQEFLNSIKQDENEMLSTLKPDESSNSSREIKKLRYSNPGGIYLNPETIEETEIPEDAIVFDLSFNSIESQQNQGYFYNTINQEKGKTDEFDNQGCFNIPTRQEKCKTKDEFDFFKVKMFDNYEVKSEIPQNIKKAVSTEDLINEMKIILEEASLGPEEPILSEKLHKPDIKTQKTNVPEDLIKNIKQLRIKSKDEFRNNKNRAKYTFTYKDFIW